MREYVSDLYHYLEIAKAKDKIRAACIYMKDLGMFAKMPLNDLVVYVCNNYETLMEFAPGNIKSILACIEKGYWKP